MSFQNWGQRPPSPPENNVSWFLPARYTTSLSSNIWPGWTLVDHEQIQYPSEAASPRQPDKGSRVEGIPNQLFPALLRPRWWWHSYYSRRRRRERRRRGRRRTTTRGKHRVAMRGRRHLSSSPDRPSDAAAFVVRRAARHSSSPPPPEVVRLMASACPRSLLLREPGRPRATPLHMAIARGTGINAMGALRGEISSSP